MTERRTKPASGFREISSSKGKRLLCALLLLGMGACAIVACTKPEADSKGNSPGNVLRFDVWGPINSLDPNGPEGGSAKLIFPFIYSYLFIENEKGELEPDLATDWSYDRETFTWTIKLRPGVLFHDGRPVTAFDVKSSLEISLRRFFPAAYILTDRITPLSELEFSIVLHSDDPSFLNKIWTVDILPVTDETNGGFSNHPIGSGPFRFSYRDGEKEVGLVANEDYYRSRPSLDGVTFYFVPDKEKTWARLLSSKTDLALGIDPPDFEIMKHQQDRFYFNTSVNPYLALLLYNTHDPLFSDPGVRMALTHAIDKEYITKVILKGMAEVPAGVMGHYSPFRNPELEPIPYDPGKSLQLLQQAGWSYGQDGRYLQKDGKCFEFTLLVFSEVQIHQLIAQYIRLCFDEIGIKVHLQSVPFEELAQRYWCNESFQVVLTEFTDVTNELDTVAQLWCPVENQRACAGGFDDRIITRIIGEAIREEAPLKREGLLREVDLLLTTLQPATFLYQSNSMNVISKRFRLEYPFSLNYSLFHLWKILLSAE